MFTPLTYLGFLVVAVIGPTLVLLALTRRRVSRPVVAGTAVVTTVGLLYTVPWDNALIAHGVWWYGEGAVVATIHYAPVEEYLFILLQPALTSLWLVLLRSRASTRTATGVTDAVVEGGWTSVTGRQRVVGAAAGLLVGGGGLALLATDATFYAGAIIAWAGPVFAVQWGFGWPYLWRRRRLTALAIGVPTVYLAAVDRIAIELGLWSIAPQYTTGLFVAGLPIEEGAFFLVTNAFVVQGLLLFLWVFDRPTAAEATTPESAVPNP